jgi:hypothetical protein
MKSTLLFYLFFSVSICCFAQKHTLIETVYDEDKNVLADANVLLKNAAEGIITDKKGQFTLEVQPKDTLVISYLGFEKKEIVVSDQKEITIILKSQWEAIDPVVVVAYRTKIRCKSILCCGGYSVIDYEIIQESTEEFKRISSNESLTSLFPNPSANGLFQLKLDKTYDNLTVEVLT